MSDSDNSRYALMKKTIDILATAKQTNKDVPYNHSLIVSVKTFYSTGGDPGYIFNDAAACLDSAKKSPYYTDGLIFTPNDEPMPVTGRTWASQLKWKPPHDNTIDFLVTIENTVTDGVAEDTIGYKFKEDDKQMVRHKTLRLFVGGKSDVAFKDPRDTILNNKQLPDSIDNDEYKPVEFRPLEPSDISASICHIALDAGASDPAGATVASQDIEAKSDVIYCSRTKDPITTNSIVEMAYNPEKPVGWRWDPIRVRWDKTERLQTGNYARTMNADWVADNIWTSIHNPVSEEMIRTGVLSEATKEEAPKYYGSMSKVAKRDNYIVRQMNSFHNKFIKSELLLQKTLRKGDTLLDLACGRGGDLIKWIKNKASWVMGVDFNLENLIAPKESVYGRYLDAKIKMKDELAPMVFLQADCTRNIKDGSGLMTEFDKAIGSALYDIGPKKAVPSAVEVLRGQASKGFDVVSCMFAIHYMFKDRSSVDGFIRNLSDNLKINGYFIGCSFDGDSVYKLLSGLPDGGVKTGRDKDTDIWSIRKSYSEGVEDVLPASDAGLGKAVDVYYYSIGEEHREYLVSFEYLTKRLAEIGCELLNPDELSSMGLSHSTNLFSDSHKMTGNMYNMSKTLKDFSFLNRWFIFRRRNVGKMTEPMAVALETTQEKPLPGAELIQLADAVPAQIPVKVQGQTQRPIYKFFSRAIQKDELKIGRKDWARYISTITPSNLRDVLDPSIIYPSLEAAFASGLIQSATDKPELGPVLFSVNSTIHQDYLRKLNDEPTASDSRKTEILEEELAAIRHQIKPAELKRLGVKFNPTQWASERDDIMQHFITERYNTDTEFKRIMDAIKAKNGILVYWNGPNPGDLGGLVKDNNTIVGQNKLGIMYMNTVGLEP